MCSCAFSRFVGPIINFHAVAGGKHNALVHSRKGTDALSFLPELMGRHGKPLPYFHGSGPGDSSLNKPFSSAYQENAHGCNKEGHAAAGQNFSRHAAAVNEPQQDAVACREKNDNGCLGRINGEMPPPSEPFPEQKKEECHKNQALHAGFQCTDGRKHTAGARESGVF